MSEQNDNKVAILVDFGGGRLTQVDADGMSDEELESVSEESREAVNNALNTLKWVAGRAKTALDNMSEKPDEMELEFGIAITTKAGVLVLQSEAEFHIKAKLVWKNDKSEQ